MGADRPNTTNVSALIVEAHGVRLNVALAGGLMGIRSSVALIRARCGGRHKSTPAVRCGLSESSQQSRSSSLHDYARYFAGSMEVRPSIARNVRSSLPAPPRGSTICRVIEPQVYSQRAMRLDLYLGRCGLQPGQNAQPRPHLNQSPGESALPCIAALPAQFAKVVFAIVQVRR